MNDLCKEEREFENKALDHDDAVIGPVPLFNLTTHVSLKRLHLAVQNRRYLLNQTLNRDSIWVVFWLNARSNFKFLELL